MTGAQKAWARQKPADLARIAELEAYNAARGEDVFAPRGECSSCDAGRGVMWPDEFVDGKRQPRASCAGCRALWPKLREVGNLVAAWGERQKQPWTTEQLREHAAAMRLPATKLLDTMSIVHTLHMK